MAIFAKLLNLSFVTPSVLSNRYRQDKHDVAPTDGDLGMCSMEAYEFFSCRRTLASLCGREASASFEAQATTAVSRNCLLIDRITDLLCMMITPVSAKISRSCRPSNRSTLPVIVALTPLTGLRNEP